MKYIYIITYYLFGNDDFKFYVGNFETFYTEADNIKDAISNMKEGAFTGIILNIYREEKTQHQA